MALHWERIELVNAITPPPSSLGDWIATERAKVFGGWLVRTIFPHREVESVPSSPPQVEAALSVGMTILPDPEWKWVP